MFQGKSLWRDRAKVKPLESHRVEIKLGASYPRTMPEIRWLTPIFHPNISEIGMVCLGGYGTHWVPSVQLDELCVMLWDMARYHNLRHSISVQPRGRALGRRSDNFPVSDRRPAAPRPESRAGRASVDEKSAADAESGRRGKKTLLDSPPPRCTLERHHAGGPRPSFHRTLRSRLRQWPSKQRPAEVMEPRGTPTSPRSNAFGRSLVDPPRSPPPRCRCAHSPKPPSQTPARSSSRTPEQRNRRAGRYESIADPAVERDELIILDESDNDDAPARVAPDREEILFIE